MNDPLLQLVKSQKEIDELKAMGALDREPRAVYLYALETSGVRLRKTFATRKKAVEYATWLTSNKSDHWSEYYKIIKKMVTIYGKPSHILQNTL